MADDETPRPRKPRRWGLRTLAFLALAAVSIVTSSVLSAYHNDDFVLLTLVGLVVGLGGATVCSIRGIKAWDGLPRG